MDMAIDGRYGLGGLRDHPDFRDYTMGHEEIKPLVQKLGLTGQAAKEAGPSAVDFRQGLPSMFGFRVFSSIPQASGDGVIPSPSPAEKVQGGHAVSAVGYDNGKKIKNAQGGRETRWAFLIKNPWGKIMGRQYVLNGLAVDWGSLLKKRVGRYRYVQAIERCGQGPFSS